MTPEEEEEIKKKRKRWNLFGVIIQVVFFMANAYVWIIALACLLGGFMLGFNSRTIILQDFQWLDLIATTPATIFITYGFLMIILTSVGCFASTSGNMVMIIIFLVLVVLIIIFDVVAGICFYFNIYALPNFVETLYKSLHGYRVEGADWVGIIKLPPIVYWDHVQLRTRCCGVYEFEDWFITPIGKNWSLPDSCCNEDYEHLYCGELILRHPDTEHHSVTNIINTKGLMTKFPKALRKAFMETGHIGVTVGAAIIFCFLVAIVLLCIVLLKKYRAGGGPEYWVDPYEPEGEPKDKGDGAKAKTQKKDKNKKSWFGNLFKKNDKVAPAPVSRRYSKTRPGSPISNPERVYDDDGNYGGGGSSKRMRPSGSYT